MSPALPLPWQDGPWRHLRALRSADRLPHALLMCGPAGVGKRHFAELLCLSLLCLQPDAEGIACGRCRGCALAAAGSHPDWLRVEPEAKARQIRIDAIREVVRFTAQTASQAGLKLVLLAPAEGMNRNAANALLKCLEEPAGRTHLLMVSDQPGLLPATIRSRCQQVLFPVPPRTEVETWLGPLAGDSAALNTAVDEAGGRPMLARSLLDPERLAQRHAWRQQLLELVEQRQHALTVAATWNDVALEEVLEWLEARLSEAVKQALAPANGAQGEADQLTAALARRGAESLLRWRARVLETRAQLAAGANFSRPLVLEDLLL